MTTFQDERRAADRRYAKARGAVEKLTAETPKEDREAATLELRLSLNAVTRHARKAGSSETAKDAERA